MIQWRTVVAPVAMHQRMKSKHITAKQTSQKEIWQKAASPQCANHLTVRSLKMFRLNGFKIKWTAHPYSLCHKSACYFSGSWQTCVQPCAPSHWGTGLPSNTWFPLCPPKSSTQTASWLILPFCTPQRIECPYALQWVTTSPKKLPFYLGGGWDRHLLNGSLGSPDSVPKWHLNWFSRFCRVHERDRQTDTQTDNTTVCGSRPVQLANAAMCPTIVHTYYWQ